MNSRERVIRTLTFQNPDRIPIDLWTLPGAFLRYGPQLEELMELYPLDFYRADYRDPLADDRLYAVGEFRDAWGCVWKNAQAGIIGEVKEWPIAKYESLENYRVPLDRIDEGWDLVAPSIASNRDKFVLGGWINLFERMQFLRGTENLMIDLAEDRPELYVLRDMVMEYWLAYLDRWLRFDVDAIVFGDDWGHQHGLLISPDTWRRVFKPAYQEMFELVHQSGKFVFFHSDGHIMDLYEDFIDMGVSAINSQLWCMGVQEVAAKYAGRITFWGEISRQSVLPFGTPEDVRHSAQAMKNHLWVDGGLIGQGEVGLDVPLGNVEALLKAWN